MPRYPWPANTIAVPLLLLLVCAWDGLGYLLGPPRWSSNPTLAAFGDWPGGVRTYGACLTITALVLASGLARRSLHLVRLATAAAAGCYLANTAAVLIAWSTVGIAAWGAPSKGFAIAGCAALILRRTPDLSRG